MTSKNLADYYGIYPRRSVVRRAVNESIDAGFPQVDFSVLPERGGAEGLLLTNEAQIPKGAATGAGAGAAVGGALGWLMGIGFLAIPGVGPFIAIGPMVIALVGAGTGSLFGGIAGALIGMGVSAK